MESTASGLLSKTPLAHLIVYCAERKLCGALVLMPDGDDDPAHADVLTLVDGAPAKIRIADPIEHLGRIFVETGAIDDAAYNDSLMVLGRGEGLHGQILLRSGKIDAATLERGLRTQISRKVGHLFSRPASTRYAYYEGVDFLARYGGPELFPVDSAPIVWAGVRAAPSLPHLEAMLDKLANVQLRPKAGAQLSRFDFTLVEQELLALLKASAMTPVQLAKSGVADVRTTRVLVYGLLVLKQLEPAPTTGAPTAGRTVPGVPAAPIPAPAAARPQSPSEAVRSPAVPPPPPQTPSTAPPSGVAAGDRRAEIVERSSQIARENYFEILGVDRESTAEDAKNAYFQLARRWHPDRLPPDLGDLRGDVARVFALIAEAYQTLTDPARRERYEELLGHGGGTVEDQEQVARVLEAANAFQKAEFFVSKGNLAEAEPFAKKAYEMEPSEPDHAAVWCWIQANKAERRDAARYDDLVGALDRVLLDAPRAERARFYRGMILKAAGKLGDAMRDFREVAEANPKHVDAVREVRLHSMRQERDRRVKDDGSGTLLGRFMKKK